MKTTKKTFFFHPQKFNETSSTTKVAPIQTRRSRVMHVEDKSKAFRQVVRKDQLARLEEVRKAPEQWTPQNMNRRRIANPMRRNLELKSKNRRLALKQNEFHVCAVHEHQLKACLMLFTAVTHAWEISKCVANEKTPETVRQIRIFCAIFCRWQTNENNRSPL